MRGPMGNIMQQAQRMQEELKRAQEEIAKLEITGQAGAGMVTVTITGAHEMRRVKIDPSLLGDAEMLEDLIVAASNDANNKLAQETQSRMAGVAGGMNLPPGFKLPF
jgi:DNA-binding YbaB/EbfC family protein